MVLYSTICLVFNLNYVIRIRIPKNLKILWWLSLSVKFFAEHLSSGSYLGAAEGTSTKRLRCAGISCVATVFSPGTKTLSTELQMLRIWQGTLPFKGGLCVDGLSQSMPWAVAMLCWGGETSVYHPTDRETFPLDVEHQQQWMQLRVQISLILWSNLGFVVSHWLQQLWNSWYSFHWLSQMLHTWVESLVEFNFLCLSDNSDQSPSLTCLNSRQPPC